MDELILYLFGFWRFLFSTKFRRDYTSSFKRMSLGRKLLELIGALASTLVGIGVPALLVVLITLDFIINSKIDSCLDNGGSFDYQACACDYKVNHSFLSEYQCK